MERWYMWLASAVVLLAACLTAVPATFAHAVLQASYPAHGQNLAEPPPWVELRFNEPVASLFTPLEVRDSRGQRVDAGDAAVDPNSPTVLAVSLRPLEPGLYSALYRVTSVDGHPVTGVIAFTVGDAPPADLPPQVSKSAPAGYVGAARGLVQLSATLLAGLGAFLALVWLPGTGVIGPSRLVQQAALALVLTLLLAGLAEVGSFAIRASGEPFSPRLLGLTLLQTPVGVMWLVRAGLSLAAGTALALLPAARAGWRRWLLLGPAGALLLTLPLQSHARATGQWLPLLADAAHLIAAAAWSGGLAGFLLVAWPALRLQPAIEREAILTDAVPRFSRLAAAAVLLLTATGIYSAMLHLPVPDALLSTAYGRALLVKLILLMPLLALGARNLRKRGRGPLFGSVALAGLLMALVFLAAGVLSSLPPASVELATRQGPFRSGAVEAGAGVALEIAPNRIGVNRAVIRLTQPGGAPESGGSAILRLTMLEHEMAVQTLDARETEPGLYVVDSLTLVMGGAWQAEVAVLTRGGREIRHSFPLTVPPPAGQ